MKAGQIPRLVCIAMLAVADGAMALSADTGALSASGSASVYVDLAYPETTSGIGSPSIKPWLESDIRLSAESPTALFRLRVGAFAEGDKSSGIVAGDYSDALGLEVREAEAALMPVPSLALRGGILLRNFGVGSYGSPINPFARDVVYLDQSGFWGLDAEWTPAQDLSTLAILSADRLARKGSFSGFEDFDSGFLVRYSPGLFDGAAGLYASGAGGGELRPIAYLSLPVLSLLSSLEAAISFPLSGSNVEPTESLRFELRKSVDVGEASLELGAAYRGIFPGRDENEIALLATTSPTDLANLPFAPFYGRNYVELSLYFEKSTAYSLSVAASVALPWGSANIAAKAEAFIGDFGVFALIQDVVGDANGEFNSIAMAAGLPGLELRTGVEISF